VTEPSSLLAGADELSPESKAQLIKEINQGLYASGLKIRPWRLTARGKQLAPEDPKHHLPDANGFACGCKGGDDNYRIWLILAGRGFGLEVKPSRALTGSWNRHSPILIRSGESRHLRRTS